MNYRILVFVTICIGFLILVGFQEWQIRRLQKEVKTGIADIEKVQPLPTEPESEPAHPHADHIARIEQSAGMRLTPIARLISRDEGIRTVPYLDTEGKVTIGIGRSLATNGISVAELYAIVPNVDHRRLLEGATISNGRIRITTLSLAKHIFKQPLTQPDIELLLTDDLKSVKMEAASVFGAEWSKIDAVRQEAIIDLVFNLGLPHFKEFVKFIDHIKKQEWKAAAAELLRSEAARKNIRRYHRSASVIETGDPAYFELGAYLEYLKQDYAPSQRRNIGSRSSRGRSTYAKVACFA